MQNNKFCYTFDSKNKNASIITLQPDHMNGGFMPKPEASSYIDPEIIVLSEHETLRLVNAGTESETWEKIPWYIGQKLYHKTNRSEIIINDIGKALSDYPDYTGINIPDLKYAYYYDFNESTESWVFNLDKYKSDASKHISDLCVAANYTMFPQYKRDNVYAGSPVTDDYPAYLKGDAGKQSIAKLNAVYQGIAETAKAVVDTALTKEAIEDIVSGINFPIEVEILAQIQS